MIRDCIGLAMVYGNYDESERNLIYNVANQFQSALDDLRAVAAGETKALEGNVLRYLQIEERLNKHLTK